jgi:glycosyltransferase involved in cell wall biosynthesis
MYVPCASLTEFHSRSPWVMLPRSFAELGFQPSLICGSANVSTLPKSIDLVQTGVPAPRSSFSRLLRTVVDPLLAFRALWKQRPELVIIGPMGPSLVTAIPLIRLYRIGRDAQTRFILKGDLDLWDERRGRLLTVLWNALFAAATWTFDRVSVESYCSADRARQMRHVRKDRVVRVPLGFPQGLVERRSYSETPREPVILCVARIDRLKGQENLLKAFEPLTEEFPGWTVRFVGPVDDPAYLDSLRATSSRPRLLNGVSFRGLLNRDEIDRECRIASIFCLPSLKESAGQVKYEATACGLPVITTDVPCRRDAVDMGWIVVKAGEVEELRTALAALMRDETARRKVSELAQTRQESYLDIARVYLSAVGRTFPSHAVAEQNRAS